MWGETSNMCTNFELNLRLDLTLAVVHWAVVDWLFQWSKIPPLGCRVNTFPSNLSKTPDDNRFMDFQGEIG